MDYTTHIKPNSCGNSAGTVDETIPNKLPQSAFLRYRSDCPAAKLMATWKLSAQVIQENVQLPSVNIQQELDEKFLVPIDISKTGQTRCNYFLDEWNFSSLVESMLCNLDECAYYLKLFYHCLGKWQGRDCQETNTCGYSICMLSQKVHNFLLLNKNLFFPCNIC